MMTLGYYHTHPFSCKTSYIYSLASRPTAIWCMYVLVVRKRAQTAIHAQINPIQLCLNQQAVSCVRVAFTLKMSELLAHPDRVSVVTGYLPKQVYI